MRIVKSPEDRREEILECAAKLFLTYGFQKTKVEDIGKKLNISKGLAFYYFKTKEELIDAVIDRMSKKAAEPAIEIIKSKDIFPLKLAKSVQYYIKFAIEFKENFRLMINSDKLKVMGRFRESMFGKILPYSVKLADEGLKQGYIKNQDATNSMIIIITGSITYVSLNSCTPQFNYEQFLSSAANTMEMALGMEKGSIAQYL